MPKTPKGAKRPADVVSNAVHVMKIATGEIEETGTTDGRTSRQKDAAQVREENERRFDPAGVRDRLLARRR